MGLVVVTAIIVIVVNLVIDLLTAALNPKVRLS
jgi:peptide/nickel transport system permease protein